MRLPLLTRILARLLAGPATMRQLHDATGRNYRSAAIQAICEELCRDGLAYEEVVENGRGRPSLRYTMKINDE